MLRTEQRLDAALQNDPSHRARHLTSQLDYVKAMPKALAAVVRVQREELRNIDKDERLSYDGKLSDRQYVTNWARSKVDSLNAGFDYESRQTLKGLPPINAKSAEQQAAFDAKAPRLWERVRNQLDAGVDVVTVVKNADRDTLQVIEEEIDAYNLAKWPANEQLAKLETQAARHLIDQHRPTVSTPEEAKLFGQRKDIESGINNVTGAFNWARHALGEPSVRLIPAFERGQAVNIHGE